LHIEAIIISDFCDKYSSRQKWFRRFKK